MSAPVTQSNSKEIFNDLIRNSTKLFLYIWQMIRPLVTNSVSQNNICGYDSGHGMLKKIYIATVEYSFTINYFVSHSTVVSL